MKLVVIICTDVDAGDAFKKVTEKQKSKNVSLEKAHIQTNPLSRFDFQLYFGNFVQILLIDLSCWAPS